MIEPTKRVAPYLPFATFLSSLDAFTQGVPPKLDRTLWRSQSGFLQGLIMNAYRFFGLVDGTDDVATEYLLELVKNKEQRPEILQALIDAQYVDVLHGHDLSKMTMKMLEEAFERYFSVSGATKQKAITFFLKAAKFAEMPLSHFLSSQLRNTAPRKKRGSKQRTEQENGATAIETNLMDAGEAGGSHTLRFASGGSLTVTIDANPFTIPKEERDFFFSLVDRLQEYDKNHPKNEDEEP